MSASARMLRPLSLLQTHRCWPGADLAERLGVSLRTVLEPPELRDRPAEVGARFSAATGGVTRPG